MKKIFFYLISLCAIISCKSTLTNQQRAQNVIDSTIIKSLDDPKSYESVAFSKLEKPLGGAYMVSHSFRARNKFNALVLQEECFAVDTSFKDVTCCFRRCPIIHQ